MADALLVLNHIILLLSYLPSVLYSTLLLLPVGYLFIFGHVWVVRLRSQGGSDGCIGIQVPIVIWVNLGCPSA